ncbi:stage III sporulation AC/AD family protein [Hominifimenecus microfluidus]|uniref:Stage III sporulation AC/AD family protein n=1 Tax=Hominifimenecus microfluidus TaxID=2885348 RepID=A0AAE3JG98_9FIRM|nr:stage III sporulation AC/AD family protein [Hominifimenecus microfluidus]MCC2231547.1 stage III sporulation AC/AD family protein [Hominifimenecus microfluidus]
MGILTVAGIGIVTVLIAGQLKVLKSEYSLYLSVAVMLLIFFYSAGRLGGILSVMEQIQTYFPVNEIYVRTLLKIVGVSYIAEFASHVCRDAGYGAVGSQIEIFGKLTVLAVSMPILTALLETLNDFL